MPANGGHHAATGGTVVQVDQSGLFDICHVEVDILAGGSQAVTVGNATTDVPGAVPGLALHLGQNHPNPFNPVTDLDYHLPQSGAVRLKIYDVKGQEIATLIDRNLAAGHHTTQWHGKDAAGRDAPSGIYLVKLSSAGQTATRKITLTR